MSNTSKKTFAGGINSLLSGSTGKRRGRKPTATAARVITKSSQEGTKENETRATFIVNEDLLEKLKAVAYWERKLIKDVVHQALEEALAKYEKKNGPIKPIKKA